MSSQLQNIISAEDVKSHYTGEIEFEGKKFEPKKEHRITEYIKL